MVNDCAEKYAANISILYIGFSLELIKNELLTSLKTKN
jgi:hypothetical protein